MNNFLFFRNCSFVCLLCLLSLKALAQDKPTVLFMISEQSVGEESHNFWWRQFSPMYLGHQVNQNIEVETKKIAQQIDLSVAETILKQSFLEHNFKLIDIAQVSDKITVSSAYKLSNISTHAVLQMGKDVGADIVIKGKVLAKLNDTKPNGNVNAYIADITATAFRVKDGTVIAAGRGHGVARHISISTGSSNAIEKASLQLAEIFLQQMD